MRVFLVAALLQGSVREGPASQCGPAMQPLSEFEVSQPARLVSTISEGPRPVGRPLARRRMGADSIVVQFIVDTTGLPVPRTFEVLRSPSHQITERVRVAHQAWRFRPALVGGCKVPQVVRTAIEWVAPSAPSSAWHANVHVSSCGSEHDYPRCPRAGPRSESAAARQVLRRLAMALDNAVLHNVLSLYTGAGRGRNCPNCDWRGQSRTAIFPVRSGRAG